MQSPALGPTLIATICTSNYTECVSAWCDYLQQAIHLESEISQSEAKNWSCSALAGNKVTWLENALGEPWLRIIESPFAVPVKPFRHYGWLSLEICVQAVDDLRPQLQDSPFEIIGEPADLDISPDIRAMQVLGPAGEVLYLTQIKAPVAGFELPSARCPVDKLFIPVALVEDRETAIATYEQFPDTKAMQFETKVTVINKAHGFPIEQRHPVASVQLAGQNLIELDELKNLKPALRTKENLAAGISMISFAIKDINLLPLDHPAYLIKHGPWAGRRGALIERTGGELIELIELT